MTLAFCRLPRRLLIASATICSLCLSWVAQAQTDDPDAETWTEAQASPPAVFSVDNLQTFDVGQGTSLTYGIDPNTLTVGADGVVRYVLVARSGSGALNALYQGLRCQTGEVKTYGRWDNKASWNTDSKDSWQKLSSRGFTQPALALARAGICDGRTVNGNAQNILRTLKNGRPKDIH